MKLERRHQIVLSCIEKGMETAQQIALGCSLKPNTIEKALAELLNAGEIIQDGETVKIAEMKGGEKSPEPEKAPEKVEPSTVKITFNNPVNVGQLKKSFEYFGYQVTNAQIKVFELKIERLCMEQIKEDVEAVLALFGGLPSVEVVCLQNLQKGTLKHISQLDPCKDIILGTKFQHKGKELTICHITMKQRIPNDNIFRKDLCRIEFFALGESGEIVFFTVDTTRKGTVEAKELPGRGEPKRNNWQTIKNLIDERK